MSSTLAGMASTMLAVRDVMLVRAVTGAMKATDRQHKATGYAQPAASAVAQPEASLSAAATYEPRVHLHPTLRIEPRMVQHVTVQGSDVVAPPTPAASRTSPLGRPVWATKTWEQPRATPAHKRIAPRWELEANKGTMVNVLF